MPTAFQKIVVESRFMLFGVSIDLIAHDDESRETSFWQQLHRVIETWRKRGNKFYRGSPERRFLIGFPVQRSARRAIPRQNTRPRLVGTPRCGVTARTTGGTSEPIARIRRSIALRRPRLAKQKARARMRARGAMNRTLLSPP